MAFRRILTSLVQELENPVVLSVAGLAILAATLAGPFNTFIAFSMPARAIYWTVVVAVSLVLSSLLRATARELGRGRPDAVETRAEVIAIMLGMPALLTPTLLALNAVMLKGTDLEQPGFFRLFLFIAAISAVISIMRHFARTGRAGGRGRAGLGHFEAVRPIEAQASGAGEFGGAAPQEGAAEPEEEGLPRLRRRLRDVNCGRILRLSAAGHFVTVHSETGDHSLRMRFADAIDEMDTVVGYCAHRSHWVVREAIAGIERREGKLFLKISDGSLVPVSRKYRPGLEAAGVLARAEATSA